MITAESAKIQGMIQVSASNERWIDRAKDQFEVWARTQPVGRRFNGEDVRLEIVGVIGDPGHPNAWGAFVGGLNKRGRIVPTGHMKDTTDIPSHARPSVEYILREHSHTLHEDNWMVFATGYKPEFFRTSHKAKMRLKEWQSHGVNEGAVWKRI